MHLMKNLYKLYICLCYYIKNNNIATYMYVIKVK